MEPNSKSSINAGITAAWNRLLHFLQNPFVNLVVGVLITVVFFYFVERKEIDTRYAIDNVELIAAQTLDAPELELFWDKEKINDISSVKIAFWNSGKQFLSTENISKTNPIRIIVPKGVRILFAEVIETSRPTLRFSTTYSQEKISSDGILINILDDEALEHMDGGIVKILFTGAPESDFYVTGRILGNTNGFEKSKWGSSDSWLQTLALIMIFVQGIALFNLYRKAKDSKPIRIMTLILSVLSIIAAAVGSYQIISNGLFTLPKWLH